MRPTMAYFPAIVSPGRGNPAGILAASTTGGYRAFGKSTPNPFARSSPESLRPNPFDGARVPGVSVEGGKGGVGALKCARERMRVVCMRLHAPVLRVCNVLSYQSFVRLKF